MPAENSELLCACCGLKKIYLRGSRAFEALAGVELEIHRGDFIQIVGRSGSGKSTLLKLLAGLIEPDEGELEYSSSLRGENELAGAELLGRAEAISYLPQGLRLISNLTVEENVRLPYYLQAKSLQNRSQESIEKRVDELLSACRLSELRMVYPAALSGGEVRRVLLARALFLEPQLVLADEPLSDLDVRSRQEVMELIQTCHRQGSTFLIVTHELDDLDLDQTYTMSEGRLERGLHI
ncbi:MAG: ABC transporter ATP-binding protein [Eubacteriales bacterium]|nr:ABC transporter ATP-binding protein [Eubacteriales bacterium]